MAIYKRGSAWWVDTYINGRRVRRKIGPSKRDAETVLRDWKVREARGEWGIGGAERIRFEAFVRDIFWPRCGRLADSTRRNFDGVLRNHILPTFGRRYLAGITTNDIEAWLSAQAGKPSTVSLRRAFLGKVFRSAVRWGYLVRDPMQGVSPIKIPERDFHVGADVLDRFLAAAAAGPFWLWAFAMLALHTGLRRNELRTLRWEDVDLSERVVHIRNREDFSTKTRRNRVVPLNDVAISALQGLPRRLHNPYVFWSRNRPGQPISEEAVTDARRRALRRAGLPGALRTHDLRHLFGTRAAAVGADVRTLMDLMGHGSPKMAMRYVHSQEKQKRQVVERLAQRTPGQDLDTGQGQAAER